MKNKTNNKKLLPFLRGGGFSATGVEDGGVAYRKVSNIKRLKTTRKILRSNMTPAEAAMWKLLKNKKLSGRKFRRQHSIDKFILDFFCPSERLAVELDGQIHEYTIEKDIARDKQLLKLGIKVIRFENRWVWDNPDGILKEIIDNFDWFKNT